MSDHAHRHDGPNPNQPVPKEKARQGVTGMNVRTVLFVSTVGAVIAVAVVYALLR